MTLTKEQRAAYGPDWPRYRDVILRRSKGRCECEGECGWDKHLDAGLTNLPPWIDGWVGRCVAVNGQSSPYTGSRVVLTIAHLDGHLGIHREHRLMAMCQGCHLAYDRHHRETTDDRHHRREPDRHLDQQARLGTHRHGARR